MGHEAKGNLSPKACGSRHHCGGSQVSSQNPQAQFFRQAKGWWSVAGEWVVGSGNSLFMWLGKNWRRKRDIRKTEWGLNFPILSSRELVDQTVVSRVNTACWIPKLNSSTLESRTFRVLFMVKSEITQSIQLLWCCQHPALVWELGITSLGACPPVSCEKYAESRASLKMC